MRTRTLIATAAVALSAGGVGSALGASPAAPAPDRAESPARVCFPQSEWSTSERKRPCVRVHVGEDGSASVRTVQGRRYD